jgi:uncharacterized protein (DUF983 family)
MSRDIPFSARCTRCGNQSIPRPHRLALESRMDCQVCGYSGTVLDFADIPVLEAMLQEGTESVRLLH